MCLSEDQQVIQTLAPQGADQSFGNPVCQGERGEIGRSRIPIALTRDLKANPEKLP
jgi:hypothetical protein